jgi:excisionase family DNA binding protein
MMVPAPAALAESATDSVPAMPAPGDAITWREACAVLGCSMRTLARLIDAGELSRGPRWQHRQLSRADVEALALRRWDPYASKPGTYWVGTKDAAVILGVHGSRVRQLAQAGRLPFAWTADGHRAFRREQLLTVANARRARASRL